MTTFNELFEKNFDTLELYTTAITRAHGKSHPEAFDVRRIFEKMTEKVEAAGGNKPDLDAEFEELRKVTNNYEVPNDVCQTYEGTYKMLAEANHVYSV